MDSPAAHACASLGMGFLILYICIFSLTILHPSLPYVRLALAPAAIMSFGHFVYGPYEGPYRGSSSGMSAIGLYGIMRTFEHSVISFWDPSPPYWVMRKRSTDGTRIIVPLPNTFWTRCVYALDLFTAQRGLSWFSELEFNWASPSLPSYTMTSRAIFILSGAGSLLIQYLTLDFCDIILHTRLWDSKSPHAMTELPALQQIIFSICICTNILLSLTLPYTLTSCLCVLCGSSPSVWRPLFNSPFYSNSLRDFWSRRWHLMFRRVFERLSLPWMLLMFRIFDGNIQTKQRVAKFTRMFTPFALSALLHICIIYRDESLEIKRKARMDAPLFWDRSTLSFFLVQPMGLFIESTVVLPLRDWIFPDRPDKNSMQERRSHNVANGHVQDFGTVPTRTEPRTRWRKGTLTRLYVWGFLIGTGRWWCDAWVRAGMLDRQVKPAPISLLRGMWEGHWII